MKSSNLLQLRIVPLHRNEHTDAQQKLRCLPMVRGDTQLGRVQMQRWHGHSRRPTRSSTNAPHLTAVAVGATVLYAALFRKMVLLWIEKDANAAAQPQQENYFVQ